ncbi:Crp/Fnr family transcriptional regulator [Antarcticibacterium arcticum]|uniref:Crp/Fnr family transcriptional regulator n=1 Tax=Antarcticibacterium arcticum TaxID=2585771 RepID=UPI00143D3333|nr:Crp/Fnr family transcriptional regulator [Antarcticibacterium arcticum]
MNEHSSQAIFQTGEVLIRQDSPTNSIVFIKSGLVKIHTQGPNRERIMNISKAPSYLCLHSTFGDKINHFSATALEPTAVCFIESNVFTSLIQENGNFAYEVIQSMGRGELQNFHYLIDIAQKQNMGRVAHVLLYFAKQIYISNTFNLPLSRQELADLAGITRESISRILHKFHNEELIHIEGRKISLKNDRALKEISDKG